jgi:hypothetical protein
MVKYRPSTATNYHFDPWRPVPHSAFRVPAPGPPAKFRDILHPVGNANRFLAVTASPGHQVPSGPINGSAGLRLTA